MARGLAHLLATKHTVLARLVLPAAVAFGCAYTVSHGTNPLEDARAWVTGEWVWNLCDSVCGARDAKRGLGRGGGHAGATAFERAGVAEEGTRPPARARFFAPVSAARHPASGALESWRTGRAVSGGGVAQGLAAREGGVPSLTRRSRPVRSPTHLPLLKKTLFSPGDARPAPRITAVQFAPGRR